MSYHLDGRAMTDRTAAHDHLKERLALPDYYGRNLDALYDVLMEIGTDTEIILMDPAAVAEQLGKYGEALLYTIQAAPKAIPT